ncbi:hypothetical protein ACFWGP_07455 [Agromyces sp. NPDC127015]|uniref:hypothetical protein n=1 Tax=Agromyces sp. NPDC127015 TaxID=3347108 RepID=UPI0036587D36
MVALLGAGIIAIAAGEASNANIPLVDHLLFIPGVIVSALGIGMTLGSLRHRHVVRIARIARAIGPWIVVVTIVLTWFCVGMGLIAVFVAATSGAAQSARPLAAIGLEWAILAFAMGLLPLSQREPPVSTTHGLNPARYGRAADVAFVAAIVTALVALGYLIVGTPRSEILPIATLLTVAIAATAAHVARVRHTNRILKNVLSATTEVVREAELVLRSPRRKRTRDELWCALLRLENALAPDALPPLTPMGEPRPSDPVIQSVVALAAARLSGREDPPAFDSFRALLRPYERADADEWTRLTLEFAVELRSTMLRQRRTKRMSRREPESARSA